MGNEMILQGITVYGAPRVLPQAEPESADKPEQEAVAPPASEALSIGNDSGTEGTPESDSKPAPPLLLEVRVHPRRAARQKLRRQILLRSAAAAVFTIGCCVLCQSHTEFGTLLTHAAVFSAQSLYGMAPTHTQSVGEVVFPPAREESSAEPEEIPEEPILPSEPDLVILPEQPAILPSETGQASPDTPSEGASAAPPEAEQPVIAPVRPENAGPVQELQYTGQTGAQYLPCGAGVLRNMTGYVHADIAALAADPLIPALACDGQPEVLLISTHSTESYAAGDHGWYDPALDTRTLDPQQNVTQVAKTIAEVLQANGIGVIHDTGVYDHPQYNGAYARSRQSIEAHLEQYPSIQIVLDIHRDALETADGLRYKPTAHIEGQKAAQIMLIAGCDDGTMGMPNWRENLRFASALQDACESRYPGLTRPLLFDYRHYNQDLSPCALLVEFGGHANTLEEAVYSAELFGTALSALLLQSGT